MSAAMMLTVALSSCGPTVPSEQEIQLARAKQESVLTARVRLRDAAWRSARYPSPDLHGPFPRPKLPDSADVNDPIEYYKLGRLSMDTAAGLADRAFYWATRLDPSLADAYVARWVLLREMPWRLHADSSVHLVNRRRASEREPVDSLMLDALRHNPFVDQQIHRPMLAFTTDRDPTVAGLSAYTRRDYREAVVQLARAVREHPERVMLRLPRAFSWVRLGESDSAIADLTALADRIEQLQRDSTTTPYMQKDMIWYAIGMLHADRHRPHEARAAYQRTLVENLGFYMAHVRMAGTWLADHDTASALAELESATAIRADDPFVDSYYGVLLVLVGRSDDAVRQLHAAIAADSDFALPHLQLARVLDLRGDSARAVVEYERYLNHATQSAEDRAFVLRRLGKSRH